MERCHAGIDPRRYQGRWEISARRLKDVWIAAWEPSWGGSDDDVRYWHDCASLTPRGAIDLALDIVAEMTPDEWEMNFAS